MQVSLSQPDTGPRPLRASVASVDDIVSEGTLPAVSPLAVRRACQQWQTSLPAQVGRQDRLELQVEAGAEPRIWISRNDRVEFQAEGSQGAHDVDHVYFESAWEQLGGQPLVAASPMNEILVNGFEWALTPQWREGREQEMSLQGLPASDENFLKFQREAGRDGARQLLYQTMAEKPWAQQLFRLTGRPPESFPNPGELDLSLRLLALDARPLDEVLGLIQEFSSCAISLARIVGQQAPEFVEEVNQQRTVAHGAREGVHQFRSVALPSREHWQEQASPLVERMNGLLAEIPPVYLHGLSTQGGLA